MDTYNRMHRCRAFFKVLCPSCHSLMSQSKKFDTKCQSCRCATYQNVDRRKLSNWWKHLDQDFSTWTWCNLYKYEKGGRGSLLGQFQRKNNLPDSI